MKFGTSTQTINVLMVEDNPDDVDLTFEILKEAKLVVNLSVVTNGVDALDFLAREGQFAKASRPDLILLDLNLPKKDGREVLAEVKSHPDWRRIPVVVLTTSQADEDINKAYDLHANCYIQKPLDLLQFTKVVQCIEDFWFTIVKLPVSE